MRDSEWAEVAETLGRHGMTPEAIAVVRLFEESSVKPKRVKKVQPEMLDFGDDLL